MPISKKLKLLFLIGVSIFVVIGIIGYRNRSEPTILENKVQQRAEDAEGVIKKPETLEIPKLKIKAKIEHTGLLMNGKADVPKSYENVAWYKDGYYPGEIGNASISGHVDTPDGTPAIFDRLDELTSGDIVIVWGGSQSTLFKVYDKQVYPAEGFPIEKVYGQGGIAELTLVTCEGEMVDGRYQDRLVIFARKI